MKERIFIALLLTSISFSYANYNTEKSINILNNKSSQVEFWINGVLVNLQADTAYYFPCTKDEIINFQMDLDQEILVCGETKELSE